MAYQYQFINKLEQFGYISYDLILTDDAGVMPSIRLMKEFKSGEDTDLDTIGATAISSSTQLYQDNQMRQWVVNQIQYAASLVANYIQSTNPDLNTLNNVDAIINPVLDFYGIPKSQGLQPLLLNRLTDNTNTIINAFNQLPITDNSVPATNYFVNQVKQALGIID